MLILNDHALAEHNMRITDDCLRGNGEIMSQLEGFPLTSTCLTSIALDSWVGGGNIKQLLSTFNSALAVFTRRSFTFHFIRGEHGLWKSNYQIACKENLYFTFLGGVG